MTDRSALAERSCAKCRHAQGDMCQRDYPKMFKQRYEKAYDDSDFCGPGRRYFERRTLKHKFAAAIRALGANS